MTLNGIAVLLLPVITGLNGLIWSEAVGEKGGPWVAVGANIAALVAVGAALILAGTPAPSATSRTMMLFVCLTALNGLTAVLWLYPMVSGVRYSSLAMIEGAWPVFSVLFGWIILGDLELDLTSAIGGLAIIVGAALVFHKT